jgi:hypothetical protein
MQCPFLGADRRDPERRAVPATDQPVRIRRSLHGKTDFGYR